MRISDWSSDVCSSDLQLIAPAVVLDFSAECAVDPDFLLRDAHIEDWEAKHGRIPAGSWVLLRTDWSKRDVDGYTNRREDGAHTPGPATDAIELLIKRDVLGFGVEHNGRTEARRVGKE